MEVYSYRPLEVHEITRVLELTPGKFGDPVHLSIYHIDDEEFGKRNYETLSYAWEEGTTSQVIYCDQRALMITDSLHKALQRLRCTSAVRRLWIDQICIDQNSNAERAAQVAIMGEIYAAAKGLVIWLGETDGASDRAIRFISDFGAALAAFQSKSDSSEPFLRLLPTTLGDTGFVIPALGDERWAEVRAFLDRIWFSRLWIVQEVIKSRTKIFQCGATYIAWDVLEQFTRRMLLTRRFLQLLSNGSRWPYGIQLSAAILTYTSKIDETGEASIGSLLSMFCCQSSSEERDYVYALLSLTNDETRKALKPDYEVSVETLYLRTARLIEERDELDLLHWAPRCNSEGNSLPSWIPHWYLYSQRSVQFPDIPFARFFRAGSSRETDQKPDLETSTLTIKGRLLGELRSDSLDFPIIDHVAYRGSRGHAEQTHNILKFYQAVDQIAASCVPYRTLEDMEVVAWRTLCRDQRPEHTRDKTGTMIWKRVDDTFIKSLRQDMQNLRRSNTINALSSGRLPFVDGSNGKAKPNLCVAIKRQMFQMVPGLKQARCWLLAARLRRSENTGQMAHVTDLNAYLAGQGITSTTDGFLANVPLWARAGDRVAVLYGYDAPFILRQKLSGWYLIGECYVHGLMHGEAIDQQLGEERYMTLI